MPTYDVYPVMDSVSASQIRFCNMHVVVVPFIDYQPDINHMNALISKSVNYRRVTPAESKNNVNLEYVKA